jgi:hypothetical protein
MAQTRAWGVAWSFGVCACVSIAILCCGRCARAKRGTDVNEMQRVRKKKVAARNNIRGNKPHGLFYSLRRRQVEESQSSESSLAIATLDAGAAATCCIALRLLPSGEIGLSPVNGRLLFGRSPFWASGQ